MIHIPFKQLKIPLCPQILILKKTLPLVLIPLALRLLVLVSHVSCSEHSLPAV